MAGTDSGAESKNPADRAGDFDARALYPNSSLADLYDEAVMPPELRKAHQNNDRAVMKAYRFTKVADGKKTWLDESETVAELLKLYQKMIEEQ